MRSVEELAREAGGSVDVLAAGDGPGRICLSFADEGGFGKPHSYPSLERFAALVRAEALEEAAVIANDMDYSTDNAIARAIRAAGSKPAT